jgi:hypothetical protein
VSDRSTSTKRSENGQIGETVDLVKAYALQETIEPLRNTGRFLGYGLAGAFLLGLGIVILLVAFLRVLQTETDAFDGTWSFVPYLLALVICVLIIAVAASRIRSVSLDRKERP